MKTQAFYDGQTGTVTTYRADGTVVHVPFGDFLQSQVRHAHALREATIDAAFDAALRQVRRLGRDAGARLRRPAPHFPLSFLALALLSASPPASSVTTSSSTSLTSAAPASTHRTAIS